VNEPGVDVISEKACHVLEEDRGRVFASRQHHAGFSDCLRELCIHFESQGVSWMQHPSDIEVMCDKAACHTLLQSSGVRVPQSLGVVSCFDDLVARMDAVGKNRVFLKLCHGSSASGTVALERSAARLQAFSTSRMKEGTDGVTLHNWRTVTRYADLREIRQLVDAVCRHRAHAEVWLPKAGWQGRRFDVRIVVIGGRARQAVARLAEGPFTNLQFGARRASAVELREHIGSEAFSAMCFEAERAMACFPHSLYGGVDVLLDARRHQAHVLEVNAFGDLLPGVLHEGRDSYAWEVGLAMERLQVSTTGT
jgi:glutathione synthase/RimK-type ligase-like ATP-grasp enzyme